MLICIEGTHRTCDFPGRGGGGWDHLSPPLDPHMMMFLIIILNLTNLSCLQGSSSSVQAILLFIMECRYLYFKI